MGAYLGFSFDEKGYKHLRDIVRMRRKDLIKAELMEGRNPAKNFKLDTIFEHVIMEDGKVVEVPWYHPIDNWDNYCAYMGSGRPQRSQAPRTTHTQIPRIQQDRIRTR